MHGKDHCLHGGLGFQGSGLGAPDLEQAEWGEAEVRARPVGKRREQAGWDPGVQKQHRGAGMGWPLDVALAASGTKAAPHPTPSMWPGHLPGCGKSSSHCAFQEYTLRETLRKSLFPQRGLGASGLGNPIGLQTSVQIKRPQDRRTLYPDPFYLFPKSSVSYLTAPTFLTARPTDPGEAWNTFAGCTQNGAGPWVGGRGQPETLRPASLSQQGPLDGLSQALHPTHGSGLLSPLQPKRPTPEAAPAAAQPLCPKVRCQGLGSGNDPPGSGGPCCQGAALLAGLADNNRHTKKWI